MEMEKNKVNAWANWQTWVIVALLVIDAFLVIGEHETLRGTIITKIIAVAMCYITYRLGTLWADYIPFEKEKK